MFQRAESVSILQPEGELDDREGRLLLKRISSLLNFAWNKIVLDFRAVDHVHYRFLSELLTVATVCSHESGGIKLANITPDVLNLLKVLGLEQHFETYETVAEAILSFQDPLTQTCLQ